MPLAHEHIFDRLLQHLTQWTPVCKAKRISTIVRCLPVGQSSLCLVTKECTSLPLLLSNLDSEKTHKSRTRMQRQGRVNSLRCFNGWLTQLSSLKVLQQPEFSFLQNEKFFSSVYFSSHPIMPIREGKVRVEHSLPNVPPSVGLPDIARMPKR